MCPCLTPGCPAAALPCGAQNLNAFDESQALGLSGLWALALQFLRLFVLSTALGLGVGMASAALVRCALGWGGMRVTSRSERGLGVDWSCWRDLIAFRLSRSWSSAAP